MKVYISIPITGHDLHKQREKADLAKAALRKAGHEVVNPFEICVGANPVYADYLCADLRALSDCDAIYLCEGWQFSRGCRIEASFAKEFDKQILYEHDSSTEIYYNS